MSQAIVEDRRLSSWKEIAAYFGHDQRTVKRWEQSRGLPVRRLPGARGHVFAMVSEVEACQRGELTEPEAASSAAGLQVVTPEEQVAATAVAQEPELDEVGLAEAGQAAEQIAEAPVAEPAVRRSWRLRRIIASAAGAVGLAGLAFYAVSPSALRPAVKAQQHSAYVPVSKAKDLYLQGRFRWSKRTPEDLRAAMEDFRKAAEVDPNYAAAYAGMADCYALGPQFAQQDEAVVLPAMLKLAHKALALDPELPEGHRALAFADFYWRWDRERSRREFEKAIALAPGDAVTHLWFANTLATEGKGEEALAEVERARELQPTEPAIVADRGWVLMSFGRMDEARTVLEQLEKTNPENRMAPLWLSQIALHSHQPKEFLAQLRTYARASGDAAAQERLTVAAQAYAAGGESRMQGELLQLTVARASKGMVPPFNAASDLAQDGRNAEALQYLQKAVMVRDIRVLSLTNGQAFPSLRTLPEFAQLVQRLQKPLPDTNVERS